MKNKENNENKVKLTEKFSLNMRKKWLINGSKTLLLVAILFATYIALNLWVSTLDLPEIDVTENKIYTLSDTSKKAVESINQDVKIYAYGFEDDGQLIKLLKQYTNANSKISYEILTEENNYEKIQENDLKEGYYVLIFESGDAKKVVDASTEFSTYDYTTGQQIDTTEQTITNAILSLLVENKPKIYFTEGHGEFNLTEELSVVNSYLQNESFETNTINLATTAIPDDCKILAIMSPSSDFFDIEKDAVINYINKGGNIYFSMDPLSQTTELPNIKTILSEYGVSVQNGYIVELQQGSALETSPNIFRPQVSSTSKITQDIYTDSFMWLAYSARLNFENDDTLQSLNVEKEDLLNSSDASVFVTDLSSDFQTAMQTAETGKSVIASMMTKTLSTPETTEGEENTAETQKSVMVISATGTFMSNYRVEALSSNYPLSYLESNKDFVINAMYELADRDNTITIRKDMANSTYTPTTAQNRIVLAITFGVPVLLIIIGICIWNFRRRRK